MVFEVVSWGEVEAVRLSWTGQIPNFAPRMILGPQDQCPVGWRELGAGLHLCCSPGFPDTALVCSPGTLFGSSEFISWNLFIEICYVRRPGID